MDHEVRVFVEDRRFTVQDHELRAVPLRQRHEPRHRRNEHRRAGEQPELLVGDRSYAVTVEDVSIGGARVRALGDPVRFRLTAAHVTRVLSEPDLAASMRESGLAQAARFTWKACARATANVYAALAQERW